MIDLKLEIERLSKLPYNEKIEGIIKAAYERNELIKLFSADEDYIYDTSGQKWLAPSDFWGPVCEDININSIIIVLNDIYDEIGGNALRNNLKDILSQMLEGAPVQVYYAVCIYCKLALLETNRSSHFSSYFVNKYSYAKDLRDTIFNALKNRKDELLVTKIKEIGLIDNLYDWCRKKSKTLEECGFASVVEA